MSLGIEEDFKMWKQDFLSSLFNNERSKSMAKDSTLTSDTQTEDSKHEHESGPKSEVIKILLFSFLTITLLQEMYESSSDEDEAGGVVDLEDIGNIMTKMKETKHRRDKDRTLREMVTPEIRQSLTKQGMY